MKTALTVLGIVVFLAASPVFAQLPSLRQGAEAGQGQGQANQFADQGPEGTMSMAEKRAWIRDRMLAEFADVNRRDEIVAKVDQMPAERVDALVKLYQKREAGGQQAATSEARRKLAAAQAYRTALARQERNRLRSARSDGRAVGYAPVITWLPEGTSLGASAVVSPDRRYVRMNLQPFFSHIPRVDTFNFYTGETRTIYPTHRGQPNAYRNSSYRPPARQPTPRPYYDGLRTRNSRP